MRIVGLIITIAVLWFFYSRMPDDVQFLYKERDGLKIDFRFLLPLLWSFLTLIGLSIVYVVIDLQFQPESYPTPKPPPPPVWTVMPTEGGKGHNNILHGSAYFLSQRQKELTTAKTGLWLGGAYYHHQEGNLCTIAAPRSGKNASIININLLLKRDYPHSLVVFDPKGTNAVISARFQKEAGQKVIILDPSKIQSQIGARHGISPVGFNPLDFIDGNIVEGCEQLAGYLIPDTHDKAKIWERQARDLLTGLLLHIKTSPIYEGNRNLVELFELVRMKSWKLALEEMRGNLTLPDISGTAIKFREMYNNHPEGFGSVTLSIDKAIDWLKNPDMKDAVRTTGFDPRDLDKGGMTVYLCVPFDGTESHGTWARMVIGMILKFNSQPKDRPKEWCYYILDEFPNMGAFPEIVKKMSAVTEYRIRIWIFAQNLSQLDELYTTTGRGKLLGSASVFQAFKVKDPATVEYVSKRLGQTTEYVKWMLDPPGEKLRMSYKNAKPEMYEDGPGITRPLMHGNEVEASNYIITFSEVGTYLLRRWMYWDKPKDDLEQHYYDLLKDRADPNPNYG